MASKVEFLQKFDQIKSADFVEYRLFSCDRDGLDAVEYFARLKSHIFEHVGQFLKDYLWHKDQFQLDVRSRTTNLFVQCSSTAADSEDIPPHLYGITFFGENIDDEWFIVFLLYQISRKFTELAIKVCDNDGEFLLVEAAEQLPKWANPEVCTNRVFIINGAIKLIPPHMLSDDSNGLKKSLEILREQPENLYVCKNIQKAVNEKIKEYPAKIRDLTHFITIYTPLKVAKILRLEPQLISTAIRAFCDRDIIDTKLCRAMKYFAPDERVFCCVRMTKHLYAMLNYSKYMPDRKLGWDIPPATSNLYNAYLNGLKIASGFEIILGHAPPSAHEDDVENDKNWHVFVQSLKSKSYFQDSVENSESYSKLLNEAKDYFLKTRNTEKILPILSQQILNTLNTADNMDDGDWDFTTSFGDMPVDDNDSFLNIDEQELSSILEGKYGKKVDTFSKMSAESFSNNLNNFLQSKSEFDGVENDDDNKVDFDPDLFSKALKDILDFPIGSDKWSASSSDDESFNFDSEDDVDIDNVKDDQVMRNYMKLMDEELSGTTMGKSFLKQKLDNHNGNDNEFDDIESFNPVDVDMNAFQNLVQSLDFQAGGPGPATSLLSQLQLDKKK